MNFLLKNCYFVFLSQAVHSDWLNIWKTNFSNRKPCRGLCWPAYVSVALAWFQNKMRIVKESFLFQLGKTLVNCNVLKFRQINTMYWTWSWPEVRIFGICLVNVQSPGWLASPVCRLRSLGPRIEGGEREVGNFLISIIIILFRASSNLRKPSFLSSIFIFFPHFYGSVARCWSSGNLIWSATLRNKRGAFRRVERQSRLMSR